MPSISESIVSISQSLSGPLFFLLVLIGVYQTIKLKGIQFRYLKHALGFIYNPPKSGHPGDISSFQSLMTALAGAIGVGNIAGIATAISIGGYGSLFWMWVVSLLGMATAYSEAILAIRYRVTNVEGAMAGGPMYVLSKGLNFKKMALLFSILGAIAALGLGCMVQSNSVAQALDAQFAIHPFASGIALAMLTGAVVLGGIATIGRVAGVLVPIMAVAYITVGLLILVKQYDQLGMALYKIVSQAFTGKAAVGGGIGMLLTTMQIGIARGVFSNEAGLGSLSIAAASAQVEHPAMQGMLAMSGVFISTCLVCTITGLVLAVSGVDDVTLTGSAMALEAFGMFSPLLRYVVVIALILFAFTTVLAWAYYGEKCIEYLFGLRAVHFYRWLYTGTVIIGAVLKLDVVWAIADLANSLMALPNILAIFSLSNVVKQETTHYLSTLSQMVKASAVPLSKRS